MNSNNLNPSNTRIEMVEEQRQYFTAKYNQSGVLNVSHVDLATKQGVTIQVTQNDIKEMVVRILNGDPEIHSILNAETRYQARVVEERMVQTPQGPKVQKRIVSTRFHPPMPPPS